MTGSTGVAACTTLRDVLTGPPVRGEVLGGGPYAVYVRVPDPPWVLGLVAAGALALPLACVLPPGAAVPRLAAGGAVTVGGGSVVTPDATWRVARWWEPARVPAGLRVDGAAGARLAAVREARGTPLDPAIAAGLADAAGALAAGDADAAAASCAALLGRGPGLTPAGDDAVAGLLLATHALCAGEGTAVRVGAAVVAAAPSRTTALSAALLARAADGQAARPVVAAVRALAAGRAGRPGARPDTERDRAFAALLALGHSSGSDLAAGLLAALPRAQ